MHCMTNISSTDQTLRTRRVYPCSFNAKVLSLCQFSQFCYMYFEVSHQTTTKRFRRKKKKTCSFWVEIQLEGKIGSHCLLDCIFILASYLSYFILFLFVWKGTPPCQAKILTLFLQHFCQFFYLNQPLLWTSIYFTRCSGRSFCLQSLVWQWPQLCLV